TRTPIASSTPYMWKGPRFPLSGLGIDASTTSHRRGASLRRTIGTPMFSTRPEPERARPDQESVWDYPRPPRLEPVTARLAVVLGGETIAETTRGYRVLETSHPPNYYFPPDDITPGALEPAKGASFCEWKGRARY